MAEGPREDSVLEVVTEYVVEMLEGSDAVDVPVLWGPPTGDNTPEGYVSVGFSPDGESGDSEREWGPLGGGKLDEAFTLDICADALGGGGADLKPAYRRSTAIARDVEATIRADINFSGINAQMKLPVKLSRWRGRYYRTAEARGHRVFLTLTGTARI